MDCHQMKSVISLWILLCVLRMRPRKVAASFSSCGVESVYTVRSLLLLFSWPAKQTFPCGVGAKRDRETKCNGIFGLGRAKNGTNGHFSRGL